MKTEAGVLPSEPEASERASERTAPPARTEKPLDLQIRRLEKMQRDLAIGMRNLRESTPRPFDFEKLELAQAAKIRSVEAKLFRLRQGRLL